MALVREICSTGLASRNKAGIKVRQPLSAVKIIGLMPPGSLWVKILNADGHLIEEELNVSKVIYLNESDECTHQAGYEMIQSKNSEIWVGVCVTLTPELLAEGRLRDFIRRVQVLRKNTGLEIGERARLLYFAQPDLRSIIDDSLDTIKTECLLTSVIFDEQETHEMMQILR